MKTKRQYRFVILWVVVAVMCFLNIKHMIFAVNLCNNDAGKHYTVMSYNIDASNSDRFSIEKQTQLLDLIIRETPDILCLQELSFENLKKIKPQLDSIYGQCEVLTGDNQLWRLRLYSNFPLRNFQRYKCTGYVDSTGMNDQELSFLNQIQKQMNVMSAEFEIEPRRWVTVFSGHLRSSAYSTARRSLDEDSSWFDGISLYLRNYKIGKRIRNYEAINVRQFINKARSEGMPVIVAGDLNDWCGSTCLNILMGKDLKDAWWKCGIGFGWTYFGWHLRLRLDHILFSNDIEIVNVKVIDSNISDHKPLVASFKTTL